MSTIKQVAKNTGSIMVGTLIFRLISLFVIIYLARYLGTDGFGKYNFIFAYLAFFGVITDLGLQIVLVREMARDESISPKLIGNAYIIRAILTIAAIVLSVILITFMSYPPDTITCIYIASLTLLFTSFSDFYATIFQAKLRMVYNIIAKLIFKCLSAALILWIIFTNGTLIQVIIALVFSEMVKMLISYSFSRKFVRARFEIDFGLWKYLFKEALPLALSSIIVIIYFRTDIMMLSILQGDVTVGIYSAAYRLTEPLLLIPHALMASLFPIMSVAFKNSKGTLMNAYRHGVRFLLIFTLPIAIAATLVADEIILLIYGTSFTASITVFQILIWALIFTSLNSVLLDLLISIDKQKLSMVSQALCAVINVILNFFLIPILSYNGAAITTVATSALLFIVSFYFISRHLRVIPMHKIVIKPAICGLIMGVFIYYFIDLNIFLLLPLAAVIYLAALFAFKELQKEDIDIIKKAIGRK